MFVTGVGSNISVRVPSLGNLTVSRTVTADPRMFHYVIAIMKTNGVPCVQNPWVIATANNTIRTVLAPAGVIPVCVEVVYFDAPEIVATNLVNWVATTTDGANGSFATSAIFEEVLKLNSTTPCVVYVPEIRRWENGAIGQVRGLAHPQWDGVLVSASANPTYSGTLFTPAHELVHWFGWPGHVPTMPWNLMYGTTSSDNSVTATKRLTQSQINMIRTSSKLK